MRLRRPTASACSNWSQLLARKHCAVARFVRVACPARGTTLASGRLDRWLSVLDYLVDAATGNGLFADGLDFMLAVVKERTDPRTLPGVEAMMPGSALTRLLNDTAGTGQQRRPQRHRRRHRGRRRPVEHAQGAGQRLVLPQRARSGRRYRLDERRPAAPRPTAPASARTRGRRSITSAISPTSRASRWLRAGLTRADGDSGGFQPLVAPAAGSAARARLPSARSRGDTKPRPIAVVLPGTMGSQLTCRRRHRLAQLLGAAQGRPQAPGHGPRRDRAGRSGRPVLRTAGRIPGAQPPGRNLPLRLASLGTQGRRPAGRRPWNRWSARPNAPASRCAWSPTRWAAWLCAR